MLGVGEESEDSDVPPPDPRGIEENIEKVHRKMLAAAADLDFEEAVGFRNQKRRLEALALKLAE